LTQYLFGSLTTVTPNDLTLIGLLAIVILAITLGLAPQLYAVSTDEEFARTQGLRVRLYHIAVVSLAAVTGRASHADSGPVAGERVDGGSSGCSTEPSARLHLGSCCAIAIGVLTAVGGAAASFYLNAAPGAFIVLLAIAVFVLSWPLSYLIRRRRAGSRTSRARR
jgi:zinc transport system permease protein